MDRVIAMQKKLSAILFSVWSRQYCLQTEILEYDKLDGSFLLSCVKHIVIIQLNIKIIFLGFGSFIHLTLGNCYEIERFKFY